MSEVYYELSANKIPEDRQGQTPVDFFVFLPINKKYIKFIRQGTPVSPELYEKIKTKKIDILYSNKPIPEFTSNQPVQLNSNGMPESTIKHRVHLSEEAPIEVEQVKRFKNTTLKLGNLGAFKVIGGEQITEALDKAISGLGVGQADPEVISAFDQAIDRILEALNPEINALKNLLITTLNEADVLNDSTVITKLAILFSLPNGFASKKPIRDIICSTLLMDLKMKDLSPEEIKIYYTAPDSMSKELQKKIQEHPTQAYSIVSQEIPTATETTLQLILCHHELFNGKGYPRGVRTESGIPVVKPLALATDVYEHMIKAAYLGNPISAGKKIEDLLNEPVDPHLRRHNKKLVQNVYDFTWGELL